MILPFSLALSFSLSIYICKLSLLLIFAADNSWTVFCLYVSLEIWWFLYEHVLLSLKMNSEVFIKEQLVLTHIDIKQLISTIVKSGVQNNPDWSRIVDMWLRRLHAVTEGLLAMTGALGAYVHAANCFVLNKYKYVCAFLLPHLNCPQLFVRSPS